jgi:bacteriocin biosynthesis cyclodehydratase domain-containing protein
MPDPRSRLFLLTDGAIGAAVLAHVERAAVAEVDHARLDERTLWTADDFDAALSRAEATFAAAALDRPRPTLLRALNASAHRQGLPWTSGALQETVIRIGPTVEPGRTACYECFRRRYLTHSPHRRAEIPLEAFHGREPRGSHGGRLQALEDLAAALIAREVVRLARGEPPLAGGAYWYLDPLRGERGHHPIARVAWCRVCGAVADAPGWSVDALAGALSSLSLGARDVQS